MFYENGPKSKNKKKNSEKLELFSQGPAFGSAIPGPASALYTPLFVCYFMRLS